MSEVLAIVGGSRGTGAELAKQALEAGHLVVVGYNSKQKRAEVAAGLRDPETKKVLAEPLYDERAAIAQIDVTNPESRLSFAQQVEAFARVHGTRVGTLALLGAGGLERELGIKDAFAINAAGQVATTSVFWESVTGARSDHMMTLFAQSFQGHTPFHPNPNARVPFPDMYAPVAFSKQMGEIGLRNLAIRYQLEERDSHTLAVEVGDELSDSDPILIMKRRARDAMERIDAGEGSEEDKVLVDQMHAMQKREEEFEEASLHIPTTAEYAAMMLRRIDSRRNIDSDPSAKIDLGTVTDYLPEVALVNGVKTDLRTTGTPLDWIQGQQIDIF